MACKIKSKEKLSAIIMGALRTVTAKPALKPDTEWTKAPLLYKGPYLSGFAFNVRAAVKAKGCKLDRFDSVVCRDSKTPQDIIDAVATELKLS